VVRAHNYTDENELMAPGRWRTLAEAKRGVDEILEEGVW
jgi:hypothetical protein